MFKAVRWRPELELGIDMMDRHHRGMIRLCGSILETAGARTGAAAAGDQFLELAELTAMHFEAEEELMRRSNYPGRMDHQDRHHELSLLLKSWENRARHRDRPLNSSFLQHLNQWVENHILGSDKGFSRFLLGREGQDPTEPTPRKMEGCLARKFQSSQRFRPQGQGNSVPHTVDGGPDATGESRLVRQASVTFKPVSCDRFAQTQTVRRRLNRSLTRLEHF